MADTYKFMSMSINEQESSLKCDSLTKSNPIFYKRVRKSVGTAQFFHRPLNRFRNYYQRMGYFVKKSLLLQAY